MNGTANARFTQLFRRLNNGWSVLMSFRAVAKAGMPHARPFLARQYADVIDEWECTGVVSRVVIGIKDSDGLSRVSQILKKGLTEQAMSNAALALDAASIVFGHSVVDEAVSDCLEITTIVAPQFWEAEVAQKRATLDELRKIGYPELLNAAIRRHYL